MKEVVDPTMGGEETLRLREFAAWLVVLRNSKANFEERDQVFDGLRVYFCTDEDGPVA
jgi:hypothetical protein